MLVHAGKVKKKRSTYCTPRDSCGPASADPVGSVKPGVSRDLPVSAPPSLIRPFAPPPRSVLRHHAPPQPAASVAVRIKVLLNWAVMHRSTVHSECDCRLRVPHRCSRSAYGASVHSCLRHSMVEDEYTGYTVSINVSQFGSPAHFRAAHDTAVGGTIQRRGCHVQRSKRSDDLHWLLHPAQCSQWHALATVNWDGANGAKWVTLTWNPTCEHASTSLSQASAAWHANRTVS